MWYSLPRSTRVLGNGFRHIAKMQARGYHKIPRELRKPSVPKQQPRRPPPLTERQQSSDESKPLRQDRAGSAWLGEYSSVIFWATSACSCFILMEHYLASSTPCFVLVSVIAGDALEMKRQVADIYAAITSLRQQSVQTRILDLPEDAKHRTKQGRRQADSAAAFQNQRAKVRHTGRTLRGNACFNILPVV